MAAGLLAVATLLGPVSAANAAMQLPGTAASLAQRIQASPVTFWAKPYPYGYVPWRRCPRVRVETPYGWTWERLCPAPRGVVLRRAY